MSHLKAAGASTIYIDGSFVTKLLRKLINLTPPSLLGKGAGGLGFSTHLHTPNNCKIRWSGIFTQWGRLLSS